MSTINWISAHGGDWSTGTNWEGGSVPGSTDATDIALPGVYTVTVASHVSTGSLTINATGATFDEASVGSLTLSGGLSLYNGAAFLNGANSIGSSVEVVGGLLAVGNGGALGNGPFFSTAASCSRRRPKPSTQAWLSTGRRRSPPPRAGY